MCNYKDLDTCIVDVKGFSLSSPYGDGKSLGQPLGLKSVGFIQITSNSGIIGVGETYAGVYCPELISPIVDFLKNYLVGTKIANDNICKFLSSIPFIARNGLIQSIISAIDIAIWDLRGKSLGLPCYEILNSRPQEKIKTYASSGTAVFSPEEIKQDVNHILKQGFVSYKMRVGVQSWNQDIERVSTARSMLGSNDLMIDSIMGTINPPWSEKEAMNYAKDLSSFNVTWLEEPVHPENLSGLEKISNSKIVPIAAGEAYNGKTEYDLIIEKRAVDILQFDATHSGGITFCLELAEKSKIHKIRNAVHVWGSAVAISSNASLALSSENIEILEIPMVSLEITDQMWVEKPKFKNGFWFPSEVPGLGVEISSELCEKYPMKKGSGYRL